ncbi:MAG: hypothetical protein Q9165_008824 [Trypethelium subeluteriae]
MMALGRSAIEYVFYVLVAASIYITVGAPGLPSTILQLRSPNHDGTPISQSQIEALVHHDPSLDCPSHSHTIHILSTHPLIIYIENFLSASESAHLISLSEPRWEPSTIFNGNAEIHDPTIRNSSKALLPRDTTVQCIEQRALSLQGWPRHTFIERLSTQAYGEGGHYTHHFDWGTATKHARRVSSFMVYLSADCTGGGTNFPRIARPQAGGEWDGFLEEEGEGGAEGTTFKALAGNAVFWENFDAERRGYQETIHAGMPVKRGRKVGLNVWSWYQAGYEPVVNDKHEL